MNGPRLWDADSGSNQILSKFCFILVEISILEVDCLEIER